VTLPTGEIVNVFAEDQTPEAALEAFVATYSGYFDKAMAFTGDVAITGTVNNGDQTYSVTVQDSNGLVDTMTIGLGTSELRKNPENPSEDTIEDIDLEQRREEPEDGPFDAEISLPDGETLVVQNAGETADDAIEGLYSTFAQSAPGLINDGIYGYEISHVQNSDGSYTITGRTADMEYVATARVELTQSVTLDVNEYFSTVDSSAASNTATAFSVADIQPDHLVGFEIESFEKIEGVDIALQPDGTYNLSVGPEIVGTIDVQVVWKDPNDVTAPVQTSTLRIQAQLEDTEPLETRDIGVETSLRMNDPVHILYRANDTDTWVEISAGSNRIAPNGTHELRPDEDLLDGKRRWFRGTTSAGWHLGRAPS
jgi:hypothetical protein